MLANLQNSLQQGLRSERIFHNILHINLSCLPKRMNLFLRAGTPIKHAQMNTHLIPCLKAVLPYMPSGARFNTVCSCTLMQAPVSQILNWIGDPKIKI